MYFLRPPSEFPLPQYVRIQSSAKTVAKKRGMDLKNGGV